MALYQNASDMIPEGTYSVTVSKSVELTSDPRSNGAAGIKLFFYVEAFDDEDPVMREHIECIDKNVPTRGKAKKTPYQFTCSTLTALGVAEGDIESEIRAGLEAYAEDDSAAQFDIKGLGSAPDMKIKVTHARLDDGWAENLSVQWTGLTKDKAKNLLASFGGGGSTSKPTPFGGRGTPIAPPGARQPAR